MPKLVNTVAKAPSINFLNAVDGTVVVYLDTRFPRTKNIRLEFAFVTKTRAVRLRRRSDSNWRSDVQVRYTEFRVKCLIDAVSIGLR